MHYISAIFTLITAASAIDIRFHNDQHCRQGGGLTCNNQNPGSCCNGLTSWRGISFVAIPTNWNIKTQSFRNSQCDVTPENEFPSSGRDWICHGTGDNSLIYGYGKYEFINKRKRDGDVDGASDEGCQKPDEAFFSDGRRYNISGLPDHQLIELVFSTLNLAR
jgi:hypothetical protein